MPSLFALYGEPEVAISKWKSNGSHGKGDLTLVGPRVLQSCVCYVYVCMFLSVLVTFLVQSAALEFTSCMPGSAHRFAQPMGAFGSFPGRCLSFCSVLSVIVLTMFTDTRLRVACRVICSTTCM